MHEHRWFQFSIAGLFVLTTAVAVLLAIADLDIEITAALGLSLLAGALAGRWASGSTEGQRQGAVFGTLAGLMAYVATLFPRDAWHAWNLQGACASLWAAVLLAGAAAHGSVVQGRWLQKRPRLRRRAMSGAATGLAMLLLARAVELRDECWLLWAHSHGKVHASFRYCLPHNPRLPRPRPEESRLRWLWAYADLSSAVRLTWLPNHQTSEPVSEAEVSHLQGLHDLEWLNLAEIQFQGNPLPCLDGLEHLRHLSLAQTSIRDADLAQLPPLPSLISLDLSDTEITDAGLAHLGGARMLLILSLRGTHVSDEGLEVLERLQLPLTNLPKQPGWPIVRLDLMQTKVSEGRVKRFRSDHPGCTVQYIPATDGMPLGIISGAQPAGEP